MADSPTAVDSLDGNPGEAWPLPPRAGDRPMHAAGSPPSSGWDAAEPRPAPSCFLKAPRVMQ